jgi:N-acetylglucosamine-6-phosphate deacetylase
MPAAHVEGPFISDREGARGVHDPAWVRPIDPAEVARWLSAGPVAIVTLSPHEDSAAAGIRALTRLGIAVAIGHTHAEPEQITAAVAAAATLSSHLGNGIATRLPRHPNILWRQLAEDRLCAGLIADGHHLPFDTLEVMLRVKGLGRAFLVSDSTKIGGRLPGRYRTAVGSLVELDTDKRLSAPGGELLAGAAATLLHGVRNVATHTSFSLADALALATRAPARHLPASHRGAGRIAVGAPADLILLDDNTADSRLALVEVVQAGRRVRPASAAIV